MKKNFSTFIFKIIFCILILSSFDQVEAFSLHFYNYYYHFNNADFNAYNEKDFNGQQAFDDDNSDDALNLSYALLLFKSTLSYKGIALHLELARQAHWGADNFQGRDDAQNPLLINKAYINLALSENDRLSIGRQYYKLGQGHSQIDYFFSEVVDALLYKHSFKDLHSFEIMLDLLSNSVDTGNIGIHSIIQKDEEQIADFQGNTASLRFGMNLALALKSSTFLRLFSFYVNYGANTQGGADLAENGKNKRNRPDGDHLFWNGLRLYSKTKSAGEWEWTLAYSKGEDKQFAQVHDYSGIASVLSYNIHISKAIQRNFNFSIGHFSDGYMGMKGRSMASVLLWSYKGYYASPFVDAYHFRDYAKEDSSASYIDRTTSKSFLLLNFELTNSIWSLKYSYLSLYESKTVRPTSKCYTSFPLI